MDVIDRIQGAVNLVEQARSVPLSASCVVHRGELLELLDQASLAFPKDLATAQGIIATREKILEEARESADSIIERAREEVARMVSQTEIVAAARAESKKILAEVQADAQEQRAEIDKYIDSRLATLEVILNKTLDVVERGREKLDGVGDKDALSELAD